MEITAIRQYRKGRLDKRRAVECLGGACVDCGLRSELLNVYDFHHLDPAQKEFNLGTIIKSADWTIVERELKKCALLCVICHRTRHEQENADYVKGLEEKHKEDLVVIHNRRARKLAA